MRKPTENMTKTAVFGNLKKYLIVTINQEDLSKYDQDNGLSLSFPTFITK